MTQEQKIKGNGIIAVFMDAIHPADKDGCYYFNTPPVKYATAKWHSYAMQYHSSFEWIIPACKKWDSLIVFGEIRKEYEERCDKLDNTVTAFWSCSEVFKVLVDNIQWYNQQNKEA